MGDWSWADLPEVQVGQRDAGDTSDGATFTWNRDDNIGSTMTNREIADYMFSTNKISGPEYQALERKGNFWEPDSMSWAGATSPDELRNVGVLSGKHITADQGLRNIWGNMFTRQDLAQDPFGGPSAPPGYALPIPVGG